MMIVLLLIVFGLSLGSFVNALVWRVHEKDVLNDKKRLTKADKTYQRRLSISTGRSMCMSCGHELVPRDLIPVISWLRLRGKCRYCQAPIPDTPLAEVLVAVLFVLSYLAWPYSLAGWGYVAFVAWLAAIVLFVALALYDARWYLLPNRLVFPLIGIAVLFRLTLAVQDMSHAGSIVMAGVWGVIVLAGLFYVLFQVSQEQWIGGGDVKLAVALGLFTGGPLAALLLLFLASTLGTLSALPLLLRGRSMRDTKVPFGPYLIAAAIFTVLYSGGILDWYTRLFLP